MGEGFKRAEARERDQFEHFVRAPKQRSEVEEEDLITLSMQRIYEQEFMARSLVKDFCPDVESQIVLRRCTLGVEIIYGRTVICALRDAECPGLSNAFVGAHAVMFTAVVSRRCSVEQGVFFFVVKSPPEGIKANAA